MPPVLAFRSLDLSHSKLSKQLNCSCSHLQCAAKGKGSKKANKIVNGIGAKNTGVVVVGNTEKGSRIISRGDVLVTGR